MINPKYWVPDATAAQCRRCRRTFSLINRRHHCRHCGEVFCSWCSDRQLWLRPLSSPIAEPLKWCFPSSVAAVRRLCKPRDNKNGLDDLHEKVTESVDYHNSSESDTIPSAAHPRCIRPASAPGADPTSPKIHYNEKSFNKKEVFRSSLSHLQAFGSGSPSKDSPKTVSSTVFEPDSAKARCGGSPSPSSQLNCSFRGEHASGPASPRRMTHGDTPSPVSAELITESFRSTFSSSISIGDHLAGTKSAVEESKKDTTTLEERSLLWDPYAPRRVDEDGLGWYHVRVCMGCFDYLSHDARRTANLDVCEGKGSAHGLVPGRPSGDTAANGPGANRPPPLVSVGNLSANTEDVHVESLITLYVQSDPPSSPAAGSTITRSPNPKGILFKGHGKPRVVGPCDASMTSQSTRFGESMSSAWNAICSHFSMSGSRSSVSGSGNHTRHPLFKGVILDNSGGTSLKASKSDHYSLEKRPYDTPITESKDCNETNPGRLSQLRVDEAHQKERGSSWNPNTPESVNGIASSENLGCPPPVLAFMPRHLTLTPKQRSICVLLFDERPCVCCRPPSGGGEGEILGDDPQLMPNGLPKLSLFLARSIRLTYSTTTPKNNTLIRSLFSEPRRSSFTIRALFEELAESVQAGEAPRPRGAGRPHVASSDPAPVSPAASRERPSQRRPLKHAYGAEVDLYNMSGIPRKDIVLVARPEAGGASTGPNTNTGANRGTGAVLQAKPSPGGLSSSSSAGTTPPSSQSRPGVPMPVRLQGLAMGRDVCWPDRLQLPSPSPIFGLTGVLAPAAGCCANRAAAIGDIGAQLTRMSVDIEGYLVVILRNSSGGTSRPREDDDSDPHHDPETVRCSPAASLCTSSVLTTTSLQTPTYTSMGTNVQSLSSPAKNIATHTHALPGAAGGVPLHTRPPSHGLRAAMEAPGFSGGQLIMLYQRIASCGGRVPPMVVLDVCSNADMEGMESAESGVGGSMRLRMAEPPHPNDGATAHPFTSKITPLLCMQQCLQRFMRNVSHAARQLNIGYISATYEDHYWAPGTEDSSRISMLQDMNSEEGVTDSAKSRVRRPLLEQPLELLLSQVWARELQALQAECTP